MSWLQPRGRTNGRRPASERASCQLSSAPPTDRRANAAAYDNGRWCRPTIACESEKWRVTVTDAWVYIDESQAPYATGVDKGQPFWLGALLVDSPIGSPLISSALEQLRKDPDIVGSVQDAATLERSYFHASEDSKNAHSWLCRAIRSEIQAASFSATQWFFDAKDGEDLEGSKLHQMATLLSTSTALQDGYDCVHVIVAERIGTFDQTHIQQWPDLVREQQLGSFVRMPALPCRFPRIVTTVGKPSDPGIQVADFVLWAIQRSKPNKLTPTGNRDWQTFSCWRRERSCPSDARRGYWARRP